MPYDLFISDVQRDNQPPYPGDLRSWVTALHDELLADFRKSDGSSPPVKRRIPFPWRSVSSPWATAVDQGGTLQDRVC